MADSIPGASAASELCCLPGTYEPALHPRRAVVQRKIDGVRCLYIDGTLYSREGAEMTCAAHALGELRQLEVLFGHNRMFVDAEFQVDDAFEPSNSAFKHGKPGQGVLHVFDAVPFDQWAAGGRTAPLLTRLEMLANRMHDQPFRVLRRVEYIVSDSWQQTDGRFRVAVSEGGEGIVVKDRDSSYSRGRSRQWLKWKSVQTIDARCHTVNTAGGKLRSIGVHLPDGTDLTVGSGWAPNSIPDGLLGGTIEIAHNGLTSTGALRHARFLRVR